MDYRSWQKYREQMKLREIKEREADVLAPRPPINASVNDQAIRDLLDRVSALEAKSSPFQGALDTFGPRK